MTVTRSQTYRKPSSNTNTMICKINQVPLNAKGHPTVGHLTTRKSAPISNHFLERCDTLETTAMVFLEMVETIDYHNSCGTENTSQLELWCEEVYHKLFDFVHRSMEPTFDEIDAMLLVCRVLLKNKMKHRLEEFILNCPKKFIVTYSNNSERTPYVLHKLDKMGLRNVRAYLISHVHESKLGTWNEIN